MLEFGAYWIVEDAIIMQYLSEYDKVTFPPILTIRSSTSIFSVSVKSEETKRNVFPFITSYTGIAITLLSNGISGVSVLTSDELAGDVIYLKLQKLF